MNLNKLRGYLEKPRMADKSAMCAINRHLRLGRSALFCPPSIHQHKKYLCGVIMPINNLAACHPDPTCAIPSTSHCTHPYTI